MYAYNEVYLEDAMIHLGEMMDYVVYDLKYDADEYWKMFSYSKIGEAFQDGFPKYNAGMSGIELAREVIHEVTGEWIDTPPTRALDCTREYWAGWVMAYYQHQRDISFSRMLEYNVTISTVIKMYILHEADIQTVAERLDQLIAQIRENRESQLKRLRQYAKLTQKQLAERSGVTLRMIQLYEQGQNDISKAQVSVVLNLAKALHCRVEDLL